MNLAVIIAIYKRQDLTRICFEHLSVQQKKFGFDVIIAGSEGSESENLVREFGFNYIETPNEPLGQKMNLLSIACIDYDGVIVLGSDDFLPDNAFAKFYTLDMSVKAIYGFRGCYFYSTKDKRLNFFNYQNTIKTIGAGRLYTGEVLKAINFKPWSDDQPKGLDTNAMQRCMSVGAKEIVLDQVTMIDVKHSHNVTSHAILRTGQKVTTDLIVRDFSQEFLDKLNSLNYASGQDQLKIRFKKKSSMKNVKKLTVEIIGSHPSLVIGSKKTLPVIIARGLIKNGMAKLYVESEDEKLVASKGVPDFKPETPKVTEVKVAEPMTTKSAVKINNKKTKNK